MLIELLSTSNYVSYNVKLAEILGLHSAIYLSELMSINDKAIRKQKLDNDNHFKLKREYITSRTTFDEKEQLEIEKQLLKLEILKKGETEDDLSLNIPMLTTIMMSTDDSLIDDIHKIIKGKKSGRKRTKDEVINDKLKDAIETTNEELREAYCGWIDAVVAKQGHFSKAAITYAQETIDDFSKRNLDVALALLKIATVHSYRDINWAINLYNKQNNVNYKILNTPKSTPPTVRNTELSEEVF